MRWPASSVLTRLDSATAIWNGLLERRASSTAWVAAASVSLSHNRFRIEVDVSDHHLVVHDAEVLGEVVLRDIAYPRQSSQEDESV